MNLLLQQWKTNTDFDIVLFFPPQVFVCINNKTSIEF